MAKRIEKNAILREGERKNNKKIIRNNVCFLLFSFICVHNYNINNNIHYLKGKKAIEYRS